jgi:uncharacterized protein
MPSRKFHMHDGRKGAAVAVRVTPRASKNEIVEILSDDTVKVHITAPPVEGEANEALLKFLAEVLDVPKSRLDIVAGATGRDKIISVMDMDAETLHAKIMSNLK